MLVLSMVYLEADTASIANHKFTSFTAHLRGAQLPVEEIRRSLVAAHPVLPQQEVMDLIRNHNLLKLHALPAQALDQVDCLLEGHVAIVVAMDEQHRRLPVIN